ncbi:MAG: exosortase A [Kiloniellaceae bacterium]
MGERVAAHATDGASDEAPGAEDLTARGRWIWAAAALGVGLVILLALFWTTASSVVKIWSNSQAFGHGYLILPISGYLMWRERFRLAGTVPWPSLWGVGLCAAATFAWLLSDLAGILVAQQFALVAMVQGLFLTVLGLHAVRTIAFPLFFLFFAVPVGSFLIAPLQDLTAQFLVHLLRLSGFPVYLDGIFLQIPSGSFEVAEACAGLRFLISSVTLGTIFAFVFYRDTWRRLLFVGLSIVVPIVANGFRAFGVILLAHYSDYTLAARADHITFGLIFLSIVFACLLGLGMTFREPPRPNEPPAPAPDPRQRTAGRGFPAVRYVAAAVGALLLAGSASAYSGYVAYRPAGGQDIALSPPDAGPAWRRSPEAAADWRPNFAHVDADALWTYRAGDRRVDIYLAYYTRQRQGAEVVNTENRLTGGDPWVRAGTGRVEAIVDGAPLTVGYKRILSPSGRRMVWYWYWVDGRFTSSPYVAKLLEIKAKLLGDVQAAAMIAVATDYVGSPPEANRILREFLGRAGPFRSVLARAAS